MSQIGRMRLAVVADGLPTSPRTNSGVAANLTRALSQRPEIELVWPIDGTVGRKTRALLAILTVRPTRRWWWSSFNLGVLNIITRALVVERRIRSTGVTFDYVLKVRNIHWTSARPYILFIDNTTVAATRGWAPWAPSRVTAVLRRRIEARSFSQARFIFTAGEIAAESVVRDYGIDARRVKAVGGGLNFATFPSITDRDWTRLNILFVGVDLERKGGDVLLRAMTEILEEVPDAELRIVGVQGESRPGITFLGRVDDRTIMGNLYEWATIFCHPARYEPYGLVVQEALAHGLPCVVSSVGELSRIVADGETGRVLTSHSSSELRQTVLALFRDKEALSRSSVAARRSARLYTWDRVVSAMMNELAAG